MSELRTRLNEHGTGGRSLCSRRHSPAPIYVHAYIVQSTSSDAKRFYDIPRTLTAMA